MRGTRHKRRWGVPRWALAASALILLFPLPAASQTKFVPPLVQPKAVIWAIGDGADGSPRARALGAQIASQRVDRFLYLGDVYSRGTADQFNRNYRGVYGALDPVAAPTPGNHEWDNRETGYLPYWAAAKGVPTPLRYAFKVGRWQALSLNSEVATDPGSAQLRWLRRKLKNTPKFGTCRFAFWHRPLHSAGPNSDPDMAPLWDALKGDAVLVLNAHEHQMQAFAPIGGIVELISGSGALPSSVGFTGHPKMSFFDAESLGVVRVVLTERRARWTFFSDGGAVLDEGEVGCERPGTPRPPRP